MCLELLLCGLTVTTDCLSYSCCLSFTVDCFSNLGLFSLNPFDFVGDISKIPAKSEQFVRHSATLALTTMFTTLTIT